MKPIAKHSHLLKILICLELFVGLTVILGGVPLFATAGLIFPQSWLNIPLFQFDSYLIPGIIMVIIVGGVNVLASIFLWRKREYSLELSAVAGFDLQVWIFTQIYIFKKIDLFQALYLTFGIFILLLTFWVEGLLKRTRSK